MSESTKIEAVEPKSRRAFVKTAARVAVTVPAVTLLLNATMKPAVAQTNYDVADGSGTNDINGIGADN
jgi:hypothetical protein